MAQTKSKKRPAAKRPGSTRSKPGSQSKTRSKPKRKTTTKAPKAKPAKAKSRSSNGASGGSNPVEAVRSAVGGVGGKAKSAGEGAGKVASKAKVPLVAGGAAIAGAAGGMALAASKQGRKKGMKSLKAAMPRKPKVKIKSKDLAKAAKEVGSFGAQVGELAGELQRARESADRKGKHRSPVEVVLQGLTARR